MANEKDVRDAAGNVIGTAKAQVVRDPFGNVIGEVGPPEPEPGPSAQERIEQGLVQASIETQNKIILMMEQMARDARTARTAQDKASQWDFKGQREAGTKKADLLAKFDKDMDEINKLRRNVMPDDQGRQFLKEADRFIRNLRRHFTEEPTFALNRF